MPSERQIRDFFAATAANRFLGFELASCADDGAHLRLAPRDELLQEGGVIHGGILAALADSAAAYALVPGLGEGDEMTGVEFKVSFLSPALRDAGPLDARARVLRRGRRLGVVEVDVDQQGRAVATGLFTFLLTRRRGGPRSADSATNRLDSVSHE